MWTDVAVSPSGLPSPGVGDGVMGSGELYNKRPPVETAGKVGQSPKKQWLGAHGDMPQDTRMVGTGALQSYSTLLISPPVT